MRLLAFDHFYGQDLDAIADGLEEGEELFRLPYQRLYWQALRHFGAAAFDGVAAADLPEHASRLAAYSRKVEPIARWLAWSYLPTTFVVPTDAIFYLRPLISAFGSLGVPTVVVQKETSISPMVLDRHSEAVGRHVPFMSESMAVCSELHKEFWVRTGADPDRIHVTGQPRFDLYARRRPAAPDPPTLLYLSYDDVAYLPSDIGETAVGDWASLREATERALGAAIEAGWRVVVKEHPQQRSRTSWLPPEAELAARDTDTRALICEAGAVVAFQTTAAFEAAAAGVPVLYPAWGATFRRYRDSLLPLHCLPGVAHHVADPAELRRLLGLAPNELPRQDPTRVAEIIYQLGPLDGGATRRVLDLLRDHQGEPDLGSRPSRRALGSAAIKGRLVPVARMLAGSSPTGGRRTLAGRLRDWEQIGDESRAIRQRPLPPLGADH